MLAEFLLMQATRFPLLDSYIHRLRTGVDLSWRAGVELLLIGVVIYAVLRFLEGTRGARLMKAVLAILTGILVLALVARLLQLDRINVLYPYFVGGAFLIALVVFQPELRRGLTRIGESLGRSSRVAQSSRLIEPLVLAATNLSKRKIGALVAIERRVPMGGVMETGVTIDGDISHELLETIFWPGSALHDLGVVISRGRVAAAGCEFPLSEADPAHRIIGSRHRAALGMSLETDALVVVVSEETGAISLAMRGKMQRELSGDQLREMLASGLLGLRHRVDDDETADDHLIEEPEHEAVEEDAPKKSEPPIRPAPKLKATDTLAQSKAGN